MIRRAEPQTPGCPISAAVPSRLRWGLAILPATFAALLTLTGCATSVTSAPTPTTITLNLSGTVRGGQQPIAGVQIQLYAAGSTGYASAFPYSPGPSLLGSHVVTTSANGGFSITGDYTCPASNPAVYLVGTGGFPIPGQPANSGLALMLALGPCTGLNAINSVAVNELTTIASVWPLAPFMSGITTLGTSSTNPTGLSNAFLAVNKLVDITHGTLPGPALPTGATLPTAEINTLADIIQACIDSSGGSPGDGSACGTLFSLAPGPNNVLPTDTITAALNIAQNPGRNVAALNNLVTAKPAFLPTLGNTPPAAWTIALRYPLAGAPTGIAADQSGNLWIAGATSHTVTKLDTTGAITGTFAAGQSGNGAIAIDQSGNAWAAANTSGSILRITPTGTVTVFSGGGLTTTTSIAIDPQAQIWAAGTGNSLSAFTSSGTPLSPTSFTGGGLTNPQSIAILH